MNRKLMAWVAAGALALGIGAVGVSSVAAGAQPAKKGVQASGKVMTSPSVSPSKSAAGLGTGSQVKSGTAVKHGVQAREAERQAHHPSDEVGQDGEVHQVG